MKKILFLLLTISIVFLTACEEQPIVIEQTTIDTDRKILIEEFTGANCAACPAGANIIKTLQDAYGDKIVAVSIHSTVSGALGNPISGSAYDLRTTKGDDLATLFGGLAGIPASVFNRTKFEEESRMAVLSPDTWPALVLEELEKEPIVNLTTNLQYDESTRTLTIEIEAIPLEDKTGDFRVGAMITESKIIDFQNDAGVIDSMYQNDHVLRDIISSPDGDILSTEFVINVPVTKTYSFTIPEEDGIWVAQNCNVITYVSEVNQDEGTIKVLQADEEHLDE